MKVLKELHITTITILMSILLLLPKLIRSFYMRQNTANQDTKETGKMTIIIVQLRDKTVF